MMVFIQLQSHNPPVLLTLNVTSAHRKQVVMIKTAEFRVENQNLPLGFLLGRVVDIDVLQESGSKAVIGMCAGQNLQDSAILRSQEHHYPVLVGTSRDVHHNLGQFGPVS